MKIVAVICNIVLFLFTCLVLLTDGLPKEAGYIIATLLVLLTPPFTLAVFFRSGVSDGRPGLQMDTRTVAIICNIALLGFICWSLLGQPPHPQEEGFVAYVVLSALTPILSLVVFFRIGASEGRLQLQGKDATAP